MSKTKQVGGTHYGDKYHPWHLFHDAKVPFHVATAIKYVYRWRNKNGIEDLKKTLTYIHRCQEIGEYRKVSFWDSVKIKFGLMENPQKYLVDLKASLVWSSDREIIQHIFDGEYKEAISWIHHLILWEDKQNV